MLLSQITPGRIGYSFTGYSIAKKEKKSISETLGLISLIQGLMIGVKIITICIAFLYFSYSFEIPTYLFLSVVVLFLVLFLIVIFLYSKSSIKILSKIPLLKNLVKYFKLMQNSTKNVTKKDATYMIILDSIGFLLFGLQFFFLSKAIGLEMPFLTCLMLHPLLSAVMFIPFSPTGLGFAESESAIIFYLLGYSLEVGVAFILLFRINSIIVDSIGLIDMKTIKIPKKLKIS